MTNTSRMNPRKSKTSMWMTFILLILLLLLACSGGVIYYYLNQNLANTEHINPKQQFHGLDKPIFYQGHMMLEPAAGEQEGLKIPFRVVNDLIDSTIIYEEATQSIIITTKDKVVRLKTGQLTGMVNERPFDLRFPVDKAGETIYLPITPFFEYYAVDLRENTETGAVFLTKAGDTIQWGRIAVDPKKPESAVRKKDEPEPTIPMRSEASLKAPIYADLPFGAKVMIWEETTDGWYHVQLDNGYMGYVEKANLILDHTEAVPPRKLEKDPFIPWKPVGGKLNLTWEQVIKKTPDANKFTKMKGLNIVSPTWFHLIDGEGHINNLADPSYIKWAHAQGLQIWALFSNGFKPDWTTEAIASYDKRMGMIKQILAYAKLYKLQGINIDFENIYVKDMANFTQFIREMTPLMHEQGLVVSIDVTVKSGSEMWSLFADRRALGEVVDYMMVMTYDEHWAGDPIAGSVASLPWVEKGILDIMNEDNVPASKLLLGVPYYTRIWTEQSVDGITSVTSKAVSMDTVRSIIDKHKLTPLFSPEEGQNYVEYVEEGKLNKIWIEDAASMKARIDLVKKYDLAGVASWRRGFETPDIWNVISTTLEQRP